MSHASRLGADSVSRTLAHNRLGVPAVVFFVISAATPLTVVAGVITTGFAVTGIIGLPIAFVAMALLLALFSVGYVAMSRHITNAGAFYTYVTHGLGRPAGVGAAWMALFAYNALQVGLYGIIGAAAAPLFADWFGVEWSWWVIALIAWAIVGTLGVLRVDINGAVLAVLLLTEIAIILIYSISYLTIPADGEITFDTLSIANSVRTRCRGPPRSRRARFRRLRGVGRLLRRVPQPAAYGPAGDLRVDRDHRRRLRAVVVGDVGGDGSGPDCRVHRSERPEPGTIFILADMSLGEPWVTIGSTLFATSVLAAMISFHNTCARYGFALGRERVLPGALGQTSPRSGAPVVASVIQSLIGLAVILIYAIAGWDPILYLFFTIGVTGGFGVLVLIAVTSIAVVAFFAREPSGENAWRRTIAPVSGCDPAGGHRVLRRSEL